MGLHLGGDAGAVVGDEQLAGGGVEAAGADGEAAASVASPAPR